MPLKQVLDVKTGYAGLTLPAPEATIDGYLYFGSLCDAP